MALGMRSFCLPTIPHMRIPLFLLTAFRVASASAQDLAMELKLSSDLPLEMPALHPYPLYASASIGAPATVTGVVFTVDGSELPTALVNGAYEAWWTPAAYGTFAVEATATASDGSTVTESRTISVSDAISDRTAITFDGAVIDWSTIGSQWYTGRYVLPQSVGAYERITAHLAVSCPSVEGGCDDWDRLAYVQAKAPNGEWVEIIRYITPYGRACDHSIDVTDFASLLQGDTEIRMYIDTWGTGGWKLDLDLTYTAGAPEYLYTSVQPVWHGNYNFGDPADLQPVDTVQVDIPAGVSAAALRLVTTGHAWGSNNTGNAAEFYHATHHVLVNGQSFAQDLWTDCNPNPDGCSPQGGSWQYDRAGWCPGSISAPYVYDLTPLLAQEPLELWYRFQTSYVDQCHPNNPNCITGTTCADCNDGYNPYYPVSAYVIGHSNAPITLGIAAPTTPSSVNAVRITPNPSTGRFGLRLDRDMGACVVTVHDVSGATLRTWFMSSRQELEAHPFDITKLAQGTYFVRVQGRSEQVAATVLRQ